MAGDGDTGRPDRLPLNYQSKLSRLPTEHPLGTLVDIEALGLGIIANKVAVIPSESNPIAENTEVEERKVVTRICRGSLKRENVCRPEVENREEEDEARDHEVRNRGEGEEEEEEEEEAKEADGGVGEGKRRGKRSGGGGGEVHNSSTLEWGSLARDDTAGILKSGLLIVGYTTRIPAS